MNFRTFTQTCYSFQELDQFLNSIIAAGYQPWIYREYPRLAWWGGAYRWAVDVCVTSIEFQIAPKAVPEKTGSNGCKFHSSKD